jgi:putative ABC transport system substrate-binding protein
MRRREFVALAGAGVAWPLSALAQQPGRTYRLGFLLPLTRDAPVNVDFLDRLRRRGFIEGQNLTVEWRAWGGHFDLISQYTAELVKARVDVIVAVGDDAVRAIQQATKTIPIVGMAADMLGVRTSNLAGAAGQQFNRRQCHHVRH